MSVAIALDALRVNAAVRSSAGEPGGARLGVGPLIIFSDATLDPICGLAGAALFGGIEGNGVKKREACRDRNVYTGSLILARIVLTPSVRTDVAHGNCKVLRCSKLRNYIVNDLQVTQR